MILTALLTWDAFGYWGNLSSQLTAFAATGLIAGRVAYRWPTLTVGLSLGASWGFVGVFVGVLSIADEGPIRSAGLVLVYVIAATVTASVFGRRRRLRILAAPVVGKEAALELA